MAARDPYLELAAALADLVDPEPTDWRADGPCQVDPELFFPGKGENSRAAKLICWQCPVREQCLEFALTHRERYGIWGGLTEQERRRILRRRATQPGEAA